MVSTQRLAAALAGLQAGIQAQGVWTGRRQLFVQFAGEGETATLFTADALARQVVRTLGRTVVHSIAIVGPDALGSAPYLAAALAQVAGAASVVPPVMLDTDGQRPDGVELLRSFLRLVQVTLTGAEPRAIVDRAMETLQAAAKAGCDHALVLAPRADAGDAPLLRVVEQAHAASPGTVLVVHPSGGDGGLADRRWSVLVEQASAVHGDVRLLLRLPPGLAAR